MEKIDVYLLKNIFLFIIVTENIKKHYFSNKIKH